MTVTMVDGKRRDFGPPLRPILCDFLTTKNTDVIDGDTGEVLVSHGQWDCVDVPFGKIEIDLCKPPRVSELAELRDSLSIAV